MKNKIILLICLVALSGMVTFLPKEASAHSGFKCWATPVTYDNGATTYSFRVCGYTKSGAGNELVAAVSNPAILYLLLSRPASCGNVTVQVLSATTDVRITSAPVISTAGGTLACGVNSYVLNWGNVSGADSYGIHILDDTVRSAGAADCTGNDVCVGGLGNSYTATNLQLGHSYEARAYAHNLAGWSAPSNTVKFTVPNASCNCISQTIIGITPGSFYQLVSQAASLAVEARNGSIVLGTASTTNDNQSWGLVPLDDGYYYSIGSKGGGYLSGSGSSLSLSSSVTGDSQKWCFETPPTVAKEKDSNWFSFNNLLNFINKAFAQNGGYVIVNKQSPLALDASSDGTHINTGPLIQRSIGGSFQVWSIPTVTPINGKCDTSIPRSCTSGSVVDPGVASSSITWGCQGVGGGTTVSCSSACASPKVLCNGNCLDSCDQSFIDEISSTSSSASIDNDFGGAPMNTNNTSGTFGLYIRRLGSSAWGSVVNIPKKGSVVLNWIATSLDNCTMSSSPSLDGWASSTPQTSGQIRELEDIPSTTFFTLSCGSSTKTVKAIVQTVSEF